MTQFQLEIQLVAAVVSVACALPGCFLVLRQMAMMSDAISHAILPGIVVAFFFTGSLSSPLLLAGGAATGLITVALVEMLRKTQLIREDAAIGLVFPALFSVGVLLIAQYAGDVHLDIDVVLLGELAFVPFDRWIVGGMDLGPRAFYVTGGVGLACAFFLILFYKELKLATFDAGLAAALGFMPALLHYGLMALVSITAVAVFDAVGSVLVVAFMVGPPAAAYLLTDRLHILIGLAAGIGVVTAIAGYWIAYALDGSIAGSMAFAVGLAFGGAFLFAPNRGVVALSRRRARQRWTFALKMLTIHLLQHERGLLEERRVEHMQDHMRWSGEFAQRVVRIGVTSGHFRVEDGELLLLPAGRTLAKAAITDT